MISLDLLRRLETLQEEADGIRQEIAQQAERHAEQEATRNRMVKWFKSRKCLYSYEFGGVTYQVRDNRIIRFVDNAVAVLYGQLPPIEQIEDVPLENRIDIALELIRDGPKPDWHFLSGVRLGWVPKGEFYYVHVSTGPNHRLCFNLIHQAAFRKA